MSSHSQSLSSIQSLSSFTNGSSSHRSGILQYSRSFAGQPILYISSSAMSCDASIGSSVTSSIGFLLWTSISLRKHISFMSHHLTLSLQQCVYLALTIDLPS